MKSNATQPRWGAKTRIRIERRIAHTHNPTNKDPPKIPVVKKASITTLCGKVCEFLSSRPLPKMGLSEISLTASQIKENLPPSPYSELMSPKRSTRPLPRSSVRFISMGIINTSEEHTSELQSLR